MTRHNNTYSCGRTPSAREINIADAGYDETEEQILSLVRFFFQSFAQPETHAWMHGFDLADAIFGEVLGPQISLSVTHALRGVRFSRRSVFMFNSPTCGCCSVYVTEHEHRLMRAFGAVRCGRVGTAKTELMMLCEGNDTDHIIAALTRLSSLVAQPVTSAGCEASHV